MGVVICDSASCGACGISSDGCQKIFAVTKSHGGSPGLPAEVIYTPDAGATIGETNITTMLASEDPSGLACVGTYLVVISSDGLAAHYASLAAILAGTASWTKVTTGLVASKTPNAIFSLGSTFNWVVANGGYIYFTADITAGFSVLTAGSVSVNNLVAIHGVDENNLVAVGASNTVLVTHDGGTTWASVTGPAVGVQLNTIWMKTDLIWLVGTAGGKLFYTRDGGATWTEKAFSGSGAGAVSDIKFSTNSVGYMAHKTAAPVGRIFRTLDGGNSWYVLPEQSGQTVPDNDGFNSLAACGEDPNVVYGGGLGANALDGILVKLA